MSHETSQSSGAGPTPTMGYEAFCNVTTEAEELRHRTSEMDLSYLGQPVNDPLDEATPGSLADFVASYEADDKTLADKLKWISQDYPDVFTAQLNEVGTHGLSSLHLAVYYCNCETAELLLARGADPLILTRPSRLPLPGTGATGIREGWTAFDMFKHAQTYRPWYSKNAMRETLGFNVLVKNLQAERISLMCTFANADRHFHLSIKDLQEGDFGGVRIPRNRDPGDGEPLVEVIASQRSESTPILFHVPYTNTIILAKIAQILRAPLQQRLADSDELLRYEYCRKLNASANIPDDPLLRYKACGYEHRELPADFQISAWKYQAVVFPCLMLRTVRHHKAARNMMECLHRQFHSWDEDSFDRIQMERTLDEAYYPGLSREILQERNEDQVVMTGKREMTDSFKPILMVAQLWLWRADNVVVSAFASQGLINYDEEDPLEIIRGWDVDHDWTRSVDLLVIHVLLARIKAFGRPFDNGVLRFPPVLNMFEDAVVSALSAVDRYVQSGRASEINTNQETQFVHILSDVRSELVMIQDVLDQQSEVLTEMFRALPPKVESPQDTSPSGKDNPSKPMPKVLSVREKERRALQEASNTIISYRKRTEKIHRDAERIEQVVQNKLAVKRTAASLQEARDSKRLSLLVIGFTVMTIIFTPLSFMASLFAINIDTWASLKYTPVQSLTPSTSNRTSGNAIEQPEGVYSGSKMAGIFVGAEIMSFIITAIIGLCLWRFLVKWLEKENVMSSGTKASSHERTDEQDARANRSQSQDEKRYDNKAGSQDEPEQGQVGNAVQQVADAGGVDGLGTIVDEKTRNETTSVAKSSRLRRIFIRNRVAVSDEEARVRYAKT